MLTLTLALSPAISCDSTMKAHLRYYYGQRTLKALEALKDVKPSRAARAWARKHRLKPVETWAYVYTLLKEAERRGLLVDSARLGIRLVPSSKHRFGGTSYKWEKVKGGMAVDSVYISLNRELTDPGLIRATAWHELGHALVYRPGQEWPSAALEVCFAGRVPTPYDIYLHSYLYLLFHNFVERPSKELPLFYELHNPVEDGGTFTFSTVPFVKGFLYTIVGRWREGVDVKELERKLSLTIHSHTPPMRGGRILLHLFFGVPLVGVEEDLVKIKEGLGEGR